VPGWRKKFPATWFKCGLSTDAAACRALAFDLSRF
jgi:hypothetical protein